MRAFPLNGRWLPTAFSFALLVALCLSLGAGSALAQADSTSANLSGFVRDPQGAVVPGATVTARNPATNETRTGTSNEEGFYQLTNLPPGTYRLTIEAPNFKTTVIETLTVTVGQRADLDVALEVGQVSDVVTVTGASAEMIETSKTNVSNTIDQTRIQSLPINQRDYINFTLTTSTVTRDNGRPIGPAPTSGLNFGGQRGRSNLVQVDGADNTDNSVNAARSTVSQEAVQEFQVVTNSFAPEFGRTAGGVVNVVTKSGTNEVHGNVFGFIRHKSIQARNAFAPVIDNDPNKKPPFTRAQYGATIGGPFDRDRTFGFFAFEQRKRQESGFFTSDVIGQLTASATIPVIPGVNPIARTFTRLTQAQAAFINTLVGSGVGANICAARAYGFLASSGGNTGLTGSNPLTSPNDGSVCPAISPVLGPTTAIGPRFLLSGAPVPVSPNAFRPLLGLDRVFPISEDTTFSSIRIDHKITDNHQMSMRGGFNPSEITGIQVESQNQSLGQNDFSRTGIQTLKDASFVTTLTSTLTDSVVNEARFSFSSRRATFTSQNGAATAFNISGTAFTGRELFSPVIRTENRYQWSDNINWVKGNHTFKFGGDANFIAVDAIFELNFAGLFNFGGLPAASVNSAFPASAPSFTPVQQYGLGLPENFVQGFGNPVSRLKNKPLSWFAQDSWKIHPRLTLNYGVRYDYEITDQLAVADFTDPLSGITQTAAATQTFYDAFGIQQGFPRDKNNFAPRVGAAWDVRGNGNTVLRAAVGVFYDHPLLAIGFNSDIADNVQQQQYVLLPGQPGFFNTTTGRPELINAVQVFQGTVCTQAALSPVCQAAIAGGAIPAGFQTAGVAGSAIYQFGRQRFDDQRFPGFGPFLPFSLPVSTDFEYASANQANVTLEQKLTDNMSFSASWLFTGAHHLPHPTNLNGPNVNLLVQNFVRCFNRQPVDRTEILTLSPAACSNIVAQPIPGLVSVTTRGGVVQPFAANLFRPSGPNYFFVQSQNPALTPAVFNGAITGAGTLARPGFVTTFGDINAQVSDGNSVYHAANFELRRRFANNFQFLASYTWSHSIDDSSDLQTLLLPQDVTRLDLERADSLFDQRHRFVFSGVLASPASWRGAGGMRSFLADFIVAPIFEISSGRPFNILSGTDTNRDLSSSTDRPNVRGDGTLCVPGPPDCGPLFAAGSLSRNSGITESYSSLDLRVARTIRFGERFAARFGVSEHTVQQRLRLGTVSPALLDRYRQGEMNLDVVMAFTLSDDHAVQERVWADLPSWNRQPDLVRRLLTKAHTAAGDPFARFVGIAAYGAAGGRLLEDLFDESRCWLLDGDLLGRLAAEKLEGVAATVRAEGWRWVEVGFGYPQGSYGWRRVFPTTRAPTPEEDQERERLETRLEQIAVALEAGEDDALAGEAAGIEERLAAIDSGLDAFTPEQLALAGAVVWLDHQGAAAIDRGFVRPEHEPAPVPQEPGSHPGTDAAPVSAAEQPDAGEAAAPAAGDTAAPEDDVPRPLSERLVEDLTAHRTAGLRLALAEQPETALIAVVHALAVRLFHGRPWDPGSCLDLQPREAQLAPCSETIQVSPAVVAFEAARRRWRARLPGEEGALWDWLLAADPATRLELLAFCAGAVVETTQRRGGQTGRGALAHADRLATAVGLDLRACWSPTKAAYLDRVSKRHVLAAVTEVAGEAKAEAWAGLKKDALVELAEPVLTEARWLPEPLRTPAAASDALPAEDGADQASEAVADGSPAAQAA